MDFLDELSDLSGVDFDAEDDPQEAGQRSQEQSRLFWRLLKDDRASIIEISGAAVLAGGVQGLSKDGASILVSAKKLSEGCWQLSKEEVGDWQKAYLLNYERGKVTCVSRADYEAGHDFFLTVTLSGCRFTLTETHVLHIAADAGMTSSGRDRAEAETLANLNAVPGRKRSVSVTSRDGSILYHSMPGAALAHTAHIEAMKAMAGKMVVGTNLVQIAQGVVYAMRDLGASKGTIEKAALELKKGIAGKVVEGASADGICSAFADAVAHHVVRVSTMMRGAFVIGLKVDAAWKYYVLANGVWAEILPG